MPTSLDDFSKTPVRRPGRQLNISGAKKTIVFCVGTLTALASAITGLGAQLAFAPMLTWMLGFNAEKAQGTALRYAMVASACAVFGAVMATIRPLYFPWSGFLLFLGATVGAILTTKLAPKPHQVTQRRAYYIVGMAVSLFVILQTSRQGLFVNTTLAQWDTPLALAGIGLACGALTQALALPGGLLLIPALHFLSGLSAASSVVLSLFVVMLASMLPAWGYAQKGLVDAAYSRVALWGAILGGITGGFLLTKLPEKAILYTFAVVAMFLCARELSRLTLEKQSISSR